MSIKKIAILIFFAGTAFWMFFLQNLPFTFGDDLNVIFFANHKTWHDLILAFINPVSPALYVHGMASLESTRAFEPLLFRGIYSIFGYAPNAFWIVKAASMGLVSALMYLLIRQTTDRNLISILGAIFFLVASPLYRGIAWIADLEILAQLGTIFAVYCFLQIYSRKTKHKIAFLVLMVLSYWIGMKVKETGRLFPFFTLGFITLDQNFKIWEWLKQNLALTLILVVLLFTVIPFAHTSASVLDERAQQATRHFNLSNLKLILWSNPMSSHTPADLAHTFQWPLFILAAILTLWIVFKRNPAITYFLVWFGLALAGTCMGFHLEDNERYITVVLVPATVLVFSVFGLALNQLGSITSKILYGVLTVLTLIPIQYNFDHDIFMRNFYDGINIADWKASGLILKDRYGIDPAWPALDKFYRNPNGEFHEIRIKEWDSSIPADPASVKKVADKWKTAYVLSFKDKLFPTALAVSDTGNNSLYTKLLSKIKKKTVKKFYIYKIAA
ncbi:MAG: hypothetical protein HZC17_02500 [Candidatus Omnitrophica bacterium]|nr:hypothetical protein [Candidatus Omnitrophota bacterium]